MSLQQVKSAMLRKPSLQTGRRKERSVPENVEFQFIASSISSFWDIIPITTIVSLVPKSAF